MESFDKKAFKGHEGHAEVTFPGCFVWIPDKKISVGKTHLDEENTVKMMQRVSVYRHWCEENEIVFIS